MGTFTPIIDTNPIDFDPEELDIGNTTKFVTKMNSYMSKIQGWTDNIAASINSINTLGLELESTQLTDIAQISALKVLVAELQADIGSLEVVSGVDIADLGAKADAIAVIIASAGLLDISVVTGLQTELNNRPVGRLTPFNELPDHGSFLSWSATTEDDVQDRNTGVFDTTAISEYLTGVNGCDMDSGTEIGRFHYNNDNNGGSGGTNNVTATQFAIAMGLGTSRYSASWAVGRFTNGSLGNSTSFTTAIDGDYYRMLSTSSITKKMALNGGVSFSFWIEPLSSAMYIRGNSEGNNSQVYLDGVRLGNTGGEAHDPKTHKLIAYQCYHVAVRWQDVAAAAMHQTSAAIFMFAKNGAPFNLGCVVGCGGAFQIKPHQGIIRSRLGAY